MLILVRHGQSEYNVKKLVAGSADEFLTELGQSEAINCGKMLSQVELGHVYTSTLPRAMRTVDLILAQCEAKPIRHTASEFNERSYGVLEGLTLGECRKRFPPKKYKTWERDYFEAPPMGESLLDVSCRVVPYYTHHILPKLRAGKHVLIVSHLNVMKVLFGFIQKLDETDVLGIHVENGIPYTIPENVLNLKGSCAP